MTQANLHAGMKLRWANAHIPWKRFVVSILGITGAIEGCSELGNECKQGDQKTCAPSHLVYEARASEKSLKVNLTSLCWECRGRILKAKVDRHINRHVKLDTQSGLIDTQREWQ